MILSRYEQDKLQREQNNLDAIVIEWYPIPGMIERRTATRKLSSRPVTTAHRN